MSESPACWLCGRPLGQRIERHHPVPKSKCACKYVQPLRRAFRPDMFAILRPERAIDEFTA